MNAGDSGGVEQLRQALFRGAGIERDSIQQQLCAGDADQQSIAARSRVRPA